MLPGDRSEERVFLIQKGRTIKQSSKSHKLSTGRVTRPSDEGLPEVPIVTNVAAFPFSRLVDERYFRASETEKVCVQTSDKAR